MLGWESVFQLQLIASWTVKKILLHCTSSHLHLKERSKPGLHLLQPALLRNKTRKMITVNCHGQLKRILCSVTNWLCTNESQHCINTRLLDSWNQHLQLEWLSLQGNCVTGSSVPKCLVIKSVTRSWTSLVAQWLRVCLPMQGMQVRALVR